MDGFTLTQRIQADPQFGGAKIVLLTSGDAGDAAVHPGVSACLAKPVGEIELLEATDSNVAAGRKKQKPSPARIRATRRRRK